MNCQITINCHLDKRRAEDFDGLTFELLPDGKTLIKGTLPDQAALYCILNKIRDMGLSLVTVYTDKQENRKGGCD